MARKSLPTKEFTGSFYRIGWLKGQALKNSLRPPQAGEREVEFALRCFESLRDVYPPMVREVEGMLDASELPRASFLVEYFARHVPMGACTGVAVLPAATRDSNTIIGRNYDWVASDRQWCQAWYSKPDHCHAVLSYTHHWAGSPDGVNDHGLFISLFSLGRGRPPRGHGLQWNLLIDLVLYTCTSVEEAVGLLTGVPHLRAFSYLIADAEGNAALVEALPDPITVRQPEDNRLIATNCVVGEEMKKAICQARHDRAQNLLQPRLGTVDRDLVQTILADHEAPICEGDHTKTEAERAERNDHQTLWSLICMPQTQELAIAPGLPCQTQYRSLSFKGRKRRPS